MPRVSVVVPTYRRRALLARCLEALIEQDLPPSAYEIIVADDEASPLTRQLVETMACQARASSKVERGGGPVLRYVAVRGRHGPAAARNAGWRLAQGEIIAFTDDDTVPAPDWLRAGLSAFRDGVVGVAGRIEVPLPPIPTDYERNTAGLERGEFVTANCFYRRTALEAVGGFDERFTIAWREDADLFFRLLERYPATGCAARLVKAPAALVVHPVRPAPWGVSVMQQANNRFNALLYKKHPRLYRQYIQPSPPWRYYRIVGTLLTAFAALGLGRHRLALAAALGWLALTARFCAERLRGTSRTPRHVAEMAVTSALIPPLAVFWRLYGAVKFRVLFL